MSLIFEDDSSNSEDVSVKRTRISDSGYLDEQWKNQQRKFNSCMGQFKRVTLLNKDNSHVVTLNKIVSGITCRQTFDKLRMQNESHESFTRSFQLFTIVYVFGVSTDNKPWLWSSKFLCTSKLQKHWQRYLIRKHNVIVRYVESSSSYLIKKAYSNLFWSSSDQWNHWLEPIASIDLFQGC